MAIPRTPHLDNCMDVVYEFFFQWKDRLTDPLKIYFAKFGQIYKTPLQLDFV